MAQAKVAVITGAGQGIGAGVARSFAEAGWTVSLMSPSERSVTLARELGGIGRQGSALEGASYMTGQNVLVDGGINRAVR